MRRLDEEEDDCGCDGSGPRVIERLLVAIAPIVVAHVLDVRRAHVQASLRPDSTETSDSGAEGFGAYVARRRGAR